MSSESRGMRSLPRRLRLGMEVSTSAANNLVVRAVAHGGMGEAAAMKPGDSLVSIDGIPVPSRDELQVALREANTIDQKKSVTTIAFRRDEQIHEATVPVIRCPNERDAIYDFVELDGVRLRTIVTTPSSSPFPSSGRATTPKPAIVFLQGLTIASIETIFPSLFREWTAKGIVTMRLEHRGIGDSEGSPPHRNDFESDVAGARAAIASIARYDFIDQARVFVFGHSVGGMIAPLLNSPSVSICGHITYGSSADRWIDCLQEGARRQSFDEDYVRRLREEVRDDEVGEEEGERVIDGRPARYHRQLDEAEIAAAWRRTTRVSRQNKSLLVLHGEHDWVVGEDEAKRLSELAVGGGGEFVRVAKLDHLMTAHDSREDSLKAYGKGRFDALPIVRETTRFIDQKPV